MKLATTLDNIEEEQINFTQTLPKVMYDFLREFSNRLSIMFGINVMMAVPTVRDELGIRNKDFHILNLLKAQSIVKEFLLKKREFPDEPNFFGVLINTHHRLISSSGRSLLSFEKAWTVAIKKLLTKWNYHNFDVPNNERKLFDVDAINNQSIFNVHDLGKFSKQTKFSTHRKHVYAFKKGMQLECIEVDEITQNQKAWLPLQLFSQKHASRVIDRKYEPVLLPFNQSGVATADSVQEGQFQALTDLIAGDAFMIHWYHGIVPNKINISQIDSPIVRKIKQKLERYNLEGYFLVLETDFPVMVIKAVVIDRTEKGPAVSGGLAAGVDLSDCMERSFLEALGSHIKTRLKMQEELIDTSIASELTKDTRGSWWSTPDKIKLIESWLQGEFMRDDLLKRLEGEVVNTDYQTLLDSFKKKNYSVFSKIISPVSLTKATDLATIVSIVPQLIPVHFNEWEKWEMSSRYDVFTKNIKLKPSTNLINVPHPYAN